MSDNDKKSILVIDDDITIRKLLFHHLNLNKYNVYLASSSDEGFKELFNNDIDLVLCDIMMDKMDGFTFCQLVRENNNYRSIPFVFVTAKNTFEDKSRALEVGGDDFITKPFNIDDLLLKIKALIRRTEINRIYGTRKNLVEVFQRRSPKVVIIDDDKGASTLYQDGLSKAGIDCRIANNATEGIKLVRLFRPDLIVADIMMPEIDGFEFREMLLADADLSSIPFVFLSNLGSENEVLDGFNRDIADYIQKDRGHKIVVAKISALINSLNKERRKVEKELLDASDSVRTSVVRKEFPVFKSFKILYWHVPFSGIPGGDFIDHYQFDEDHLTIFLGDVMGKKWGAWYFAYAYAGYIRSAIHSIIEEGDYSSPGKIISKVNRLVFHDSKISEVFSTLSMVVIDRVNMTLRYAGAGDMPIIYKNKSNGELKRIDSKGILLGFKKDAYYEDTDIKMNAGDTVLMSTDGLLECRDGNGNQFGMSKLIKSIQKDEFFNSPIDVLKNDINIFNQLQFDDDVSVVAIAAKE